MTKSTFNVSFYCRNSKADKFGKSPIEMAINLNGKRSFVNLPQKIEPSAFEKAMNSKRGNEIKSFCNTYYNKVNFAISQLANADSDLTVEKIKSVVMGKKEDELTLNIAWQKWLRHIGLKVDVDIDLSTFAKYRNVQNFMLGFFDNEKPLSSFTSDDIEDMYVALKKKLAVNTAAKYMAKAKALFKYHGITEIFNNIKIAKEVKDVDFLTKDEVMLIYQKDLHNERLGRVRDLFIFQCVTGLAFTDMQQLTKDDIQQSEQGLFIKKERQKTGITYTILLLPIAVDILKKYNFQLPKISNQRMNSYLGEIAAICDIKKPLHSHVGRHTAATMFLNSGLSIETVAKVLGHSSTVQTKHYAKLLDTTVLDAMSKLK